MSIHELAALLAAAVLGLDALLHVYWMTGRTWPARDVTALSQGLLNADVPFTPRVLAPLVLVLAAGAIAVPARAGMILTGVPGWIPAAGTAAVAAGVALRAGAGVVWALGVGARRGSVFYRLNLTVYTPLCLVLTAATLGVAIG
ncbi:hypothetical protein GCM10009527_070210 [Actinomadura nitritigenes]|uniref:DUF3995 domain-containing protein n=1 Tax=Actinomadura nitritigenes TaxID=134602 RepID=A0ABS3QY17_9ACTN|nr:DUF3995 domain-containing protein [Actinomadura nitritigenes]MBO2438741.1 DUF3995 domain-containing protein [Actinomadura nitritigenes]